MKKKSKRIKQRKIQLWLSMCTRCLLTLRRGTLVYLSHYTLVVELIRGWEEEGKNIELHMELLNLALCMYIYIYSLCVESWQKERKVCCSIRNIEGVAAKRRNIGWNFREWQNSSLPVNWKFSTGDLIRRFVEVVVSEGVWVCKCNLFSAFFHVILHCVTFCKL